MHSTACGCVLLAGLGCLSQGTDAAGQLITSQGQFVPSVNQLRYKNREMWQNPRRDQSSFGIESAFQRNPKDCVSQCINNKRPPPTLAGASWSLLLTFDSIWGMFACAESQYTSTCVVTASSSNSGLGETAKLLCNFIGYRSKESSGWMFTVKQIIKTIWEAYSACLRVA